MDNINDLRELCETITREIAVANEKIRTADGKLTAADMDYVDKLTHSLKSIKAVIAMMDGDKGGYSGRGYPEPYSGYDGGSYLGGGSYRRGRGSFVRRDSMGRYTGDGYSRHGDNMVEELRNLMQDAPNEQVRQEIMRLVDRIEQQM